VDIGPDALDLTDAAHCAASEIAAADFPLATWDPTEPLRWVRGWSLIDGRDVWVPAVMTHLGVTPAHPIERFWLQTSSGAAAGVTQEQALLAACFELIERDAVAIAWLQRLALHLLYPIGLDLAGSPRQSGRVASTRDGAGSSPPGNQTRIVSGSRYSTPRQTSACRPCSRPRPPHPGRTCRAPSGPRALTQDRWRR
jgi:ribosomal protein S12 methylthiotransferase accessory factor